MLSKENTDNVECTLMRPSPFTLTIVCSHIGSLPKINFVQDPSNIELEAGNTENTITFNLAKAVVKRLKGTNGTVKAYVFKDDTMYPTKKSKVDDGGQASRCKFVNRFSYPCFFFFTEVSWKFLDFVYN